MKTISEILSSERQTVKLKSERAAVIKQFLDELTLERRYDNMRRFIRTNRLRRASGHIPYTPDQFKETNDFLKSYEPRYIAIRLAHLSISDLYYFFSVCRDDRNRGKSFGKTFFGGLKAKNRQVAHKDTFL